MEISRRAFVAANGLGAMAVPLAKPEAVAKHGAGHRHHQVRTGAQLCAEDRWSFLKGRRVGVITNPTGVLDDFSHIVDHMHDHGVNVVAVFGPEHGFRGSSPAGESEQTAKDARTGIMVYDAYGADDKAFAKLFSRTRVDTVLFDIQDVGVRFYTYIWTMYQAMRGAAQIGGIRFIVLDRPNPIGRTARGPMLDMKYASGVGLRPILMQHGMTVGELAAFFADKFLPHENEAATLQNLNIVEMKGWSGGLWSETGLPWVPPSPNMPTPDTALIYPGTGLFEATNMSEGRGTTHPFELIGAPWANHHWADRLNERGLGGVRFREAYFCPTTSKNVGAISGGVQVHLTEPERLNAPEVAAHMLCAARDLYPKFASRKVTWDKYPWQWLDLITGTTDFRTHLVGNSSAERITSGWQRDECQWLRQRQPYLRY